MANNDDIILDIKVKTEEAVKRIAELKKANDELKNSQKELQEKIKEGGDDQHVYAEQLAATQEQYKYNQKAIQALSKEVQNNLAIEREKEGSLNNLRAILTHIFARLDSVAMPASITTTRPLGLPVDSCNLFRIFSMLLLSE